jgi:hypothetical protein
MKYKNRILIAFHAILISLLLISGSYAQQAGLDPIDVERTGTAGWQFLKINVDARMAGMGGAFTAVSNGDVGSVFGNPAALVGVQNFDVAFYNISYVADINYYAAAIAKNFEGIGLFALSVNSLDMGDIPRTINSVIPGEGRTEAVVTGETFTGGDFAVGLTYARQITDQLSIGGSIRYIQESLDDVVDPLKMSNVSFDFGTIFYTGWRSLRLAMSARNFGPDQNLTGWSEQYQIEPVDIRMPIDFRLGVGMDFLDSENSPHFLTLVAEFLHPSDGPEKVNTGAEYWFNNILALRAGYRFNYDEESYTFGAGLKYGVDDFAGRVDYAFADFGLLEQVHMFTLGINF